MIEKENFDEEIRLHRAIYFDHRVTSHARDKKDRTPKSKTPAFALTPH